MKRLAEEKARRIQQVHDKAERLEVGEEVFQCYMACLPPLDELKRSLNTSGKTFEVWAVINGTMIRRTA